MFAIAKQPFEDARFPIAFGIPGDFSTMVRKEFDAAKAAGELDAAMGKVPILEVNGVKIGQSKSIERYLARNLGFAGDTSLAEFAIDAMCETVRDIKDEVRFLRGCKLIVMPRDSCCYGTPLP